MDDDAPQDCHLGKESVADASIAAESSKAESSKAESSKAESEAERESHHTLHYEESDHGASREVTVLHLNYCMQLVCGA